jgi:RNA polymerase sigma factor (sigma-70 family)
MSPTSGATTDVTPVLVDNHRRFLAFLGRRVPREVAEDILQEAFVRGMTKAPALEGAESIVAWFYRVLRNAIADYYRHAGAEERALTRLAAEPPSAAESHDRELFEAVCACVRSLVATLKPEYAAAIARVDLEGATLQHYAAEAGITSGNASVRLHRAHKALRTRLMETCGTCADHGCFECQCRAQQASPTASTAAMVQDQPPSGRDAV